MTSEHTHEQMTKYVATDPFSARVDPASKKTLTKESSHVTLLQSSERIFCCSPSLLFRKFRSKIRQAKKNIFHSNLLNSEQVHLPVLMIRTS